MKAQRSDTGDKEVGHDAASARSESTWKVLSGEQQSGSPRNTLPLSTGGRAGRDQAEKCPWSILKEEHVQRQVFPESGAAAGWEPRRSSGIEAGRGSLRADVSNEGQERLPPV